VMYSHLRLVIDPHNPWIIVNQTIDKQYCEGIQCQFLKYVSKSLNFSYQFIVEKEGVGRQLQNKSWTGFFGAIHRNVRHVFNQYLIQLKSL